MLDHVGRTVRRSITFVVVAMMMIGGLVAPSSALAQAQNIQSSLTGVTITYNAPYSLYPDGQYADDAMETMMFVGPADILAMGFMSPLIDLNGARDIMLESLFGEIGSGSTIDRGDYTGVSYSLDMLNIDGQEMGVFSLFMNQRSHGFSEFYIFLAPPTLFGTSMQTAQNSFTVDGNQLMDGVDPMAMGSMVTANIGITGGEAVTDVTDVADSGETNTTETTTVTETPVTTETTTGDTESDQGSDLGYLLEVLVEYGAVDTSIFNILTSFQKLDTNEITAEQARAVLDEESAYLVGVSDRIAQIQVPPGMQEFHQQETLVWAADVTAIGTTWLDLIEGRGDDVTASNALQKGLDTHIKFGESLQGKQVSISSSSDTPETPEPTATAAPTEVVQADAPVGDASSYVESIQTLRAEFFMSLGRFNDHLGSLEGEPTDTQIQNAREGTLTEAEYWTGFTANAQQLTPPAGYEDVHDAYLLWAADITELGNTWIAAMNVDSSQIDVFFDLLTTVQQSDDDLQAAINAASESTEDDASDGSTERTSRTSRTSTASEVDEDSGDTSDRPVRTQRTGQTSETDTGNTSETSGQASQTSSTANSDSSDNSVVAFPNTLAAELTEADISWSDDLSLDDRSGDAVATNTETGEDQVQFLLTTPGGSDVSFALILQANAGTDATVFIDQLVNEPDARANTFADDVEIIDQEITETESAILVQASDSEGDYYIYMQVTCVTSVCDTLSTVVVVADDAATLSDSIAIIEGGLAVNGTPVAGVIPPLDVED